MQNIYLEKIAANAYKRHLAGKGVNVEGISNQSLMAAAPASRSAGSFTKMDQAANRIGKKSIPGFKPMPKPSLASRVNKAVGIGPVMKTTGSVISEGALKRHDALHAQGKTLRDALHAYVSAKQKAQAAASSGVKGILGKATGLAKKHPLAVGAGAVGAGAVAAGVAAKSLMSGKSPEPQIAYSQY